MTDIMQERITLIEDLTKKRQPITNMEAIYFITPSEHSIARLMDDFRDPTKPQYQGRPYTIYTLPWGVEYILQLCDNNFSCIQF